LYKVPDEQIGRTVVCQKCQRSFVLSTPSREVRTLSGHTAGVWAVAFDPVSKRFASGGVDQSVKVWDAETGEEVLTFEGHAESVRGVTFSPDGKRIVSCSQDGALKFWSLP
jgi:WD40 repeat protein